jgi:WD40 repeat protein
MLATGFGLEGQTQAERLFQVALCYDASERTEFIEKAAGGDSVLLGELRMLLEGYAEAGGDQAAPTLGHAPTSRSQWAAVKQEEPGTVIDRFRLLRLIGEGGMGSVWEAEQGAPIRRRVALKVIKMGMDTREVVQRFERERNTLARMTHPGIAQVFEAGATPLGRPYFVMELVEGKPLTTHCHATGLPLRGCLGLFLEVCAAVEHAHQKGIVHRDLKPSNILVSGEGVKVIDFGIAKATQGDQADGLFTRQEQVLGTPAYMSPEQAESNGADVDTRTDVYSLGVILYELLVGSPPFDPKRLAQTSIREMQRILREEEPPRPSSTYNKKIRSNPPRLLAPWNHPADLDWIVMKAMAKERARRYPGAAALAEDLRRFLDGRAVTAVPPTLAYRCGKFVRRHRPAVVAVVAVTTALTVGLVASMREGGRARNALLGESKARAEATLTVADMYVRSGLFAADSNDPTRAALWFANAAVIGAGDSQRLAANRLRAITWREEGVNAVRAFDTGYTHLHSLEWNPRRPAMIAQAENMSGAQIWDLAMERRWKPDMPMGRASWSSSGDRVAIFTAAADRGGRLIVLEYPSGNELASTPLSNSADMSWSPGDEAIAAGNLLWHWRTGERQELPVFPIRLRFSPDGALLLLQWNNLAAVCETAHPGIFLHSPVPSRNWDRVNFLPDGKAYVTGQEAGGMTVWEARTGEALETHAGGAPLAVSPDGRYIARESMAMLDRQRPEASFGFPRHEGQFTAARFSPDGTVLASGGYDFRLELWPVAGGAGIVVGHHHSGVINLEFSPDGSLLASGEDGLVRLWRIARATPVRARIEAGTTSRAALSSDAKHLALAGLTNAYSQIRHSRVYAVDSALPEGPWLEPGGRVMEAAFLKDGTTIAVAVSTTSDRSNETFLEGGGSGSLRFYDFRSGRDLGGIAMPSEPRGLCLHPSGKWLGVACAGGQGGEVELATGTFRLLFDHHMPTNAGLALNNGRCSYSPDGRFFAVWSLFQFVHLWDRERSAELAGSYFADANAFDLDFTGRVCAQAFVASPMRIQFTDLFTGKEAAPGIFCSGWPMLSRFSPDGRLLLTGGTGKSAEICDWRSGHLVCPALTHPDNVVTGVFMAGGSQIVTGCSDGGVRFWDARTGIPLRPALRGAPPVLQLQLTPDGKTLIADGRQGGSIDLIDLATALPAPEIDPAGQLLLAEIDADAEVHPGGGLAPLTPQAWLGKWQEFRRRYPDFPGHKMGQ